MERCGARERHRLYPECQKTLENRWAMPTCGLHVGRTIYKVEFVENINLFPRKNDRNLDDKRSRINMNK